MSELERIETVLREILGVLIEIQEGEVELQQGQQRILEALSPSYPQSTGGTITVTSP